LLLRAAGDRKIDLANGTEYGLLGAVCDQDNVAERHRGTA
jgi:hypothetical protein